MIDIARNILSFCISTTDELGYDYRKVPIVVTLVTFGISSLCDSLLSGSRY